MAVIITDTPRRKSDFYPTPYGLCNYAMNTIIPSNFSPSRILDPGAGEGRWGKFARGRWPLARIEGLDIEDYSHLTKKLYKAYTYYYSMCDYINSYYSRSIYDLVIGNPPFSLAEEFIRKSLSILKMGGYLLFLLKTDFLAGIKRQKGLWTFHPPKEVWVCSKRPSWNTPNNTRTDSNTYAIYLWQTGYYEEPIIKWLKWDYDKDLDYE